ncbi:MAG TPA: CAAX prenyl protease-related protein [Lacipirellulaceae bacterium]|nr:CAAX prenyl protease-related protein [Lacipirellulaceae bacterium]
MGDSADTDESPKANARADLLARQPWLTFLLPFLVYMVLGSFEPAAPKDPLVLPDGTTRPAVNQNWFGLEYRQYPVIYSIKIALTLAAMAFVWPGYRQFPFRISWQAILAGVIGVVLWIVICQMHIERRLLEPLGLAKFLGLGDRPAFNPLDVLADTPVWAYTFLVIRFVGLALVVPIIEEFFLRGFIMRWAVRDEWWEVPFGQLTPLAAVLGTAVPMLMHPGELLAAFVWFSLVTWLMVRTKNIWDCVAAHAITNLLLGIYVVAWHQWQLW